MMAHELLRQVALILGAGWSKGANARDATGRIVPLHSGSVKASINPVSGGVFVARAYGQCGRWRSHDGTRAIAPSGADPWRRLVQRSERS